MKNIKSIIFSLITVFAVIGCGDSGIDERLSRSDYFVAFDTKNGVFTSSTITEGETAIISVVMGATKGPSVTVDFDIVVPTADNPQSVEYTLLTMDDQVLTDKKLVFPEGTGTQQFKFVSSDNDLAGEGTRVFTFKLLSNSAGYTIGVGSNGEASEYKVNVLDDDIWASIGIGKFADTWTLGTTQYDVEILKSILEERYRVVTPYKEGLVNDDGEWENWRDGTNGPAYVEFWITSGDQVQFTTYNLGLNYQANTAHPIKAYFPTDLSQTLSDSYSKKTGEKTYQLAPYFYMDGLGGWNNTTKNGVIVITLP